MNGGTITGNEAVSGGGVYVDGGDSICANAFRYAGNLESITIPDGITSIGVSAFYKCTALASIKLPQSLTMIMGSAFYGCSALQSITIPENVTNVGSSAFENCTALTRIDWNAESVSDFNVISHTFTSAGVEGEGIVFTAGESVKSLPANLFNAGYGKPSAKVVSATIGDNVKAIGEGTFQYCSALTSIKIGKNVESIERKAFYGCDNLASIEFPAKLGYIAQQAFCDCDSLKSAVFASADNWQVSNSSDFTEPQPVSSNELLSGSDAANFLTKIYCYMYWRKV